MNEISLPIFWSRAIILVDMNAFFASIEQLDFPGWRGRPVVVTNGERGSCVITSSYEARRFGVKTGMRLPEARALCPGLIRCAARPRRYSEVSGRIMTALTQVTPDVEVFSVDEAFLDVSRCQRLHGSPVQVARLVKQIVFEASGLLCSVGLSGDKTTAKYAAKLDKPNGFCVIPPWEAKQRLANVPVTELCGIAKGIGSFLAAHGVYYCGDMQRLPISVLARRFGNPGRRIWYMCQGADPDKLHLTVPPPKSIGHGKVMPPKTTDREVILVYLLHMAEKVGRRLRRHDFQAQHFFVGLRSYEHGFIGGKSRLSYPTQDGAMIYQLALSMLEKTWSGEPVGQVQITALDPHPCAQQKDFFVQNDIRRECLNAAVDRVNDRFGEFTLAAARLLHRSDMPNVIAPAWKPDGHRQTIE
jgi:DNA polymerase IV